MTSLASVEPGDPCARVGLHNCGGVWVNHDRPLSNQEDAVKPYTAADVDLVADAIVDARLQGHRDWTDRIARAVLDALAAAGRLLPAPIETRTEWGVWWYGPIGDGIRLTQVRFSSRQAAEEHAPTRVGDYGITRYEIRRREHRYFADHSSWSGDWVVAQP